MKRLRKILFWSHLVLGLAGGLVIAVLALTGAALALEPQLVGLLEPRTQAVSLAPGVPSLTPAELVAAVQARHPESQPGRFVFYSDPQKPAIVQLARSHAVWVHPQTGDIVAERTSSNFFAFMLSLHVRLSAGTVGNWIVTVSNVFFLLLCVTGFYLWWPKTWRALRTVTRFNFKLRGKALHWNLHNVAGVWALAVLLVITTTGLVMSYRWASDLPYTLSGTPKPAPAPVVKLAPEAPRYPLSSVLARVEEFAPGWQSATISAPSVRSGTYSLLIREAGAREHERSRLYLHGGTGELLRWQRYADQSDAQKFRALVLPLHQGSIAGLPGRLIALAACLAAVALVVTGYALSWKRFTAWRRRRAAQLALASAALTESPSTPPPAPVPALTEPAPSSL